MGSQRDTDNLVVCPRVGYPVAPFLSADAYPQYDKWYTWGMLLLMVSLFAVAFYDASLHREVIGVGVLYVEMAVLMLPALMGHRWLRRQCGTQFSYRLGVFVVGLWPPFVWWVLPSLNKWLSITAPHTFYDIGESVMYLMFWGLGVLVMLRSKLAFLGVFMLSLVFGA